MEHRWPMRIAAFAAWPIAFVWMLSCTLSADLDPLTNGLCPPDQKACGGKCVSRLDPATGCALLGCAPCLLPHANAGCGPNGLCIVASCLGTYADCDKFDDDGCEVNKEDDPVYCGSCNPAVPCQVPNGTPGCAGGHCAIKSCNAGWADCDHDLSNGCETHVSADPANCGICGLACPAGACTNGACP